MTVEIYAVTIPKWGIEMQEGTVNRWHVDVEQKISKGDDLIDIETDKIVNTMEAPVGGVLRRCLVLNGETLQVGALIGVIASADVDSADIDAFIACFEPAGTGIANDDGVSTEDMAQVGTLRTGVQQLRDRGFGKRHTRSSSIEPHKKVNCPKANGIQATDSTFLFVDRHQYGCST
jgi:pyruvate/2-oxoglutarate dehydrogenase complex dihydrolipoamide acyltransferase (E2) component